MPGDPEILQLWYCCCCCGRHVSSVLHGLVCRCLEDLENATASVSQCCKPFGVSILWFKAVFAANLLTGVGFIKGCAVPGSLFVITTGRMSRCSQGLEDVVLLTLGYEQVFLAKFLTLGAKCCRVWNKWDGDHLLPVFLQKKLPSPIQIYREGK